MPLNVQADWSVTDPLSAAYIQNKPNFITNDDLNLILATTIGPIIDEAVEEQLTPVVASVAGAVEAAEDAAAAANAAAGTVTDQVRGALYFTRWIAG